MKSIQKVFNDALYNEMFRVEGNKYPDFEIFAGDKVMIVHSEDMDYCEQYGLSIKDLDCLSCAIILPQEDTETNTNLDITECILCIYKYCCEKDNAKAYYISAAEVMCDKNFVKFIKIED